MYRSPHNYSQRTSSRRKVVAYYINGDYQPVATWSEALWQVNASSLDQALDNVKAGRVVRSR